MPLPTSLKTCFSYAPNPIPSITTAVKALGNGTANAAQKLSSLKESYDSITLKECTAVALNNPRIQSLMTKAFKKDTKIEKIATTTAIMAQNLYTLKQSYDSITLENCVSQALNNPNVLSLMNKVLQDTRLAPLSESDKLFTTGKKIYALIQVGLTGKAKLNNSLKGAQAILLLSKTLSLNSPLAAVVLVQEVIKFHDSAGVIFQGARLTKEALQTIHNLLTKKNLP